MTGRVGGRVGGRVAAWVGGAVAVGAATAWLHHTGGYAVAPAGLLTCPLHATTGLWCPFCGGLRCVAALSHGDLAAAASFNVVVLVLLTVLAVWWALGTRAAWAGRPHPWPRAGNRGYLALGVVLLVFTVWRNLPAVPLAGFLAP